jgi:COP9 signalosome complex subunit 1
MIVKTAYLFCFLGRLVILRLIHIAALSPHLAPSALQLAINLLSKTPNVTLYLSTIADYNVLSSITEPLSPDSAWADEVTAKNMAEKNRLEVELKQYTSNMIKESIRVCLDISLMKLCSHHIHF